MEYDVIVIGAGPAGVSAALYAKRANLNVLVLYYGESQLEKAHQIDNYYGFPGGIAGADLYAAGIAQAKTLGVAVAEREVTHLEMTAPAPQTQYRVVAGGTEYTARALILATGNKRLRPAVPGIVEFEGKGVSYCAVCDGFFYRQKTVAVIGNGSFAASEANDLVHIASGVTILTDGKDDGELQKALAAAPDLAQNVTVDVRKIARIRGKDDTGSKVGAVDFADGGSLEADGVFVALGSAGAVDFAKKLGLALNGDSIAVNEHMATNAPGVFSCGNANGGLLQVCKAVHEGGIAGLAAVEYVRGAQKAT